MKTRFNGVIATILVLAAATVAYGTDYYVDANYGNDAWDGTTAVIPDAATIEAGGTIAGPRKTLHAMMCDACVQPGDVVKAAEGDYNEGGDVYGTQLTTNRVQVKAGVTLLATGSRAATFITGSGGSYPDGYTNGAVRCVYFLAPPTDAAYSAGIVKGFTLRNGRTATTSEHGGASTGSGLLVECDFLQNGCKDANRGGTINGGTALRCRFSSYNRGFIAYNTARIIDSLIVVAGAIYHNCSVYNCTFSGNGHLRNSTSYNCFFIGNGAGSASQSINGSSKSKHYNTYSRTEFSLDNCTPDEACRVVTADESPYDKTTFQPQFGSVLIDAGDMSYYAAATNGWMAAWLAECGKD